MLGKTVDFSALEFVCLMSDYFCGMCFQYSNLARYRSNILITCVYIIPQTLISTRQAMERSEGAFDMSMTLGRTTSMESLLLDYSKHTQAAWSDLVNFTMHYKQCSI